MPRENVCMFSEPVEHGLDYGSCFMKRIAEEIRGASVVTVAETNGTAFGNDAALAEHDPATFYSVGHGQCCIHGVECREPYIEAAGYHCDIHFQCSHFTHDCVTDRRLDAWVGRGLHLLSCVTALNLGPELIEHGARSFIGYNNLFVYGVFETGAPRPSPCEPPGPYADFYSFNDSDAEAERAIALRGASMGEAVDALRAKFQEYIRRYTVGDWKDWPVAVWAATFLEHDLNCLVALGDMAWIPCPAAAVPPLWWLLMGLGFAPVGAVLSVVSSEEMRKLKIV